MVGGMSSMGAVAASAVVTHKVATGARTAISTRQRRADARLGVDASGELLDLTAVWRQGP
jgi:hypothetical protein